MTTYADVVASTLKDAGIEYIFGVPGSLSSVELIEAASKQGIRYILCSNESSAAVMAGVYGVMRNRPGVVSTGVGPGAAAALHGAVQLMLERAPALFLTDRFTDADYRRLPRQRIDQPALFGPTTKGTFTLSTIDTALTIQRAIDLSLEGRQGPVHVDLPYDVMLAEASEADMPPPAITRALRRQRRAATAPASRPSPRPSRAPRARPWSSGFQVNRHGGGAESAFINFAEKLGVPVFNSMAAKGTMPENHPLAAGTFRGVPSERALLDNADLLVMIGLDPIEIFNSNWQYKVPVVTLDEVPSPKAPTAPRSKSSPTSSRACARSPMP